MSAQLIFNPVIMTELTRLRTSGSTDRIVTQSPTTNVTALARVRRHLFGPIDHEENKRFVEQELADQQQLDSDRWGYDFLCDKPKLGHPKYTWEIIASDKVPEVYTGSRARILHRPVPRTPSKTCFTSAVETAATLTVTDILESGHLDAPETRRPLLSLTEKKVENLTKKEIHTVTVKHTQPRITDYMKSRKRASSAFVSSSRLVSKSLSDPTAASSSSIDSPTPIKIQRRIQFS